MSTAETTTDDRFAFGENWERFLARLDAEDVRAAEGSLLALLEEESLDGKSVLDLGAGSGLFSLAAHRLGASRVHSVDFDTVSVRCVEETRRRYAPGAESWTSARGDILDDAFVASLGMYDVVYAWGVVHHTGDLWHAVANAARPLARDGRLILSIYNDQGRRSELWRSIKRGYNRVPVPLRAPYAAVVIAPTELRLALKAVLLGQGREYLDAWRGAGRRGMRRWTDIVDWVGGYPFEVARPEEVVRFCRRLGLELVNLKTVGGAAGCNEFVFRRRGDGS